jgi:molybdopterin-guanine dinucleotide biosynthesis protein A
LIFGAILAGGAGSRIGGGKAMRMLAGQPMIAHVARALAPGVTRLAIVGDTDAAAYLGADYLEDPKASAKGPLLGIVAGLTWAAANGADKVAFAPCDTPFLPDDYVARLRAADAPLACVDSDGRTQAFLSLWSVLLLDAARVAVHEARHTPARRLMEDLGAAHVRLEPRQARNINTPEDLAAAERELLHRAK